VFVCLFPNLFLPLVCVADESIINLWKAQKQDENSTLSLSFARLAINHQPQRAANRKKYILSERAQMTNRPTADSLALTD
jgi:hypothetical protein